ncbi:YncE family protein [Acidicapsa ligni]|uniref:YncE family protein n=1 Tax=Acidicapsa ligni TaxID=542300 RepID=UPI0021E038CA|nr:YncE family protein [Acidicapsa ligni]
MIRNSVIAVCIAVCGIGLIQIHAESPITLQRTIPLTGVKGKFDHFAVDEAGHRLFAAATGNKTVEVVDLATGTKLQSIAGLGKPHGLAWVAQKGLLFVADGEKAELNVFKGSPLKLIRSIKLSDDADDLVYDNATNVLYVGHGGSDTANPASVAIIDGESLSLIANIAVAAHPEALELDETGHRVFVNISDAGQVVVIDGRSHAVVNKWQLNGAKGNTPLAYDVADDLLLVGCRTPAKLLVLNGKTGKEIASAPSDTGADDLFYEPATHRAYLITGSGAVDTFAVSADGKLEALAVTGTVAGAKTGLLVPSQRSLYIGIPGTTFPAEVRVYQTGAR